MISFPSPPYAYQFAPWTDPNGIQWIYNSVKTRWARYRVASMGGGADLSDADPQPLGTASAGTSTEASRADHVHSDQGLLKYTMMALSTEQKAQARGNIGAGTFSISDADVFGAPDTVPVRDEDGALEAIGFRTLDTANRHSVGSLGFQTGTVIDGATAGASYEIEPPAFTNSADFFRYAMPLGTGKWALTADAQGRPDALYNATIAGTLTINSTSITFGTGAAAALVGKLVEVYAESTTSALTINSTNAATYNGKMVLFSGATAHTVTFEDSIPAGFNFAWQQTGAGQVTFAGSGVTVRSYASLVKSAGQWATGSLVKTASGELALGGILA